jgi:hypothetical protein
LAIQDRSLKLFLAHDSGRFLKRVQHSAAWEEVGEDTAREKASQVLRDAVAGILEGKEEEVEDEEQKEPPADETPARIVSAPVSLDEHDQASRAYAASRSRPADFQPPRSSRSESSASKRQRYSIQASAFHSFDDSYSQNPPQPVVGYSPIRRHSDESYAAASAFSDATVARRSSSTSAVPPPPHQHVPAERPHHRQLPSGNQFELELLHGELLESDVEEEAPPPPDAKRRAY